MKVTAFFILLLAFQVSMARVTPPVSHSHNGRIHNHSLPQQGLSHKHGSSALGIAIQDNNSDIQRDSASSASAPMPIMPTNKTTTRGITNCQRDNPDCNVCAANVQQQFQQAASGRVSWQSKYWRFAWPQSYPPYNKRPLDIFDGDPAYPLGIPGKHVQGFVRTNSSHFPYAGSHSHKHQGGIFVINHKGDLTTLHPSKTKHPSGVHILGKYLVYGERSTLVFKDLNSPNQKNNIELPVPGPKANFGGGIGLVKLSLSRHLLILSGPGGQDHRPRFHRFYHLDSLNGRPHKLTFINQTNATKPAQWPRPYIFSENLTAITECVTGDIYTIHTTGDGVGLRAINGKGYWRLSQLKKHKNGFNLKPINAFENRQNMVSCHMRATATVYITPQHQLEFYCHGYAKDPDGSTFNVLGRSTRGADKFYFKVGVLR